MKKILLSLFIVSIITTAYAQSTELDNTTDSQRVPVSTGRLLLREISVDTFEDPSNWIVDIPFDKGTIDVRRLLGASIRKEEIRIEQQINNYKPIDQYVLGIRTDFYSRDFTTITVSSLNPIFIPGVVKIISVWVIGRNKNHELSLLIRDMRGQLKKIPFGKMNFNGWQKVEAIIPADIIQVNDSGNIHGLYFAGFDIRTSFEETVGSFYTYFDDMRAITDVLDEAMRISEDDMGDGW